MNLVQLAPDWLVYLLAAGLIAAAIEDVVRVRISNLTIAFVILTAIIAMVLVDFLSASIWQNIAAFALILVIGTPMFSMGVLGGGDVKLLAATALWMDLSGSALLLLSVAFAGGVLALLFVGARLIGLRKRDGSSKGKNNLPYGVAIAAGALVVVGLVEREPASGRPGPLEMRLVQYPTL